MTTVNQTNQVTKFYLPFALPKYGNAMQQNAYYVQSAGQYLAPMRSYALGVVENFGGVPVNTDTRPHNIEFKVVNGSHFMQIMREMGIAITHMLEVPGGFKCFKQANGPSVCFIQKKTTRGTGHVEYTAVLAMRHVTHELFLGVFPPQQEQQQEPAASFIDEAFSEEPVLEGHLEYIQSLEDASFTPEPEEVLPPANELDTQISAEDLPAGL